MMRCAVTAIIALTALALPGAAVARDPEWFYSDEGPELVRVIDRDLTVAGDDARDRRIRILGSAAASLARHAGRMAPPH